MRIISSAGGLFYCSLFIIQVQRDSVSPQGYAAGLLPIGASLLSSSRGIQFPSRAMLLDCCLLEPLYYPVPEGFHLVRVGPVIVDGAHNIDGITRVEEFVKTLDYKNKRCIFACSDDKEKEKMIKYLEPYFDEFIITAFTYKRHSDASLLYELSEHKNKILMNDIG